MEKIPVELMLVGLVIGIILLLVGCVQIKKSSKGWNLISLILNGQASGVGQFISGILLICAVVIIFFLSRNGII